MARKNRGCRRFRFPFGILLVWFAQRESPWRCIWGWTGEARAAARRSPTRPGRILGRGEAASANIWTDPEGARANILAAAQAALDDAGGGGRLAELRAVLGLAGANVPAAAARLAERLPFARARIESDAVIALKGALGEDDGITAALGTGSIFGVQRGGAVRMIGGWGFLLGDQGSGARMGRALLEAALLAHDGLLDAGADPARGARRARRPGRRSSPSARRPGPPTSPATRRASSRPRRPATRRRRRSCAPRRRT